MGSKTCKTGLSDDREVPRDASQVLRDDNQVLRDVSQVLRDDRFYEMSIRF